MSQRIQGSRSPLLPHIPTHTTALQAKAEVQQVESVVQAQSRLLQESGPDTQAASNGAQVLRPSALLRQSIDEIATRFAPYEGDTEMDSPVYWNHRPIEGSTEIAHEVAIERTHDLGQGTEGSSTPTERPYFLSLAGWWAGGSEGKGTKASVSAQRAGRLGSASAEASLYTETRRDLSAGMIVTPDGVEGGGWAKGQVILAGARASAALHSKSVTIGDQEVDVHAGVHLQPTLGAEAQVYMWGEINPTHKAASLAIGGEAFAGARARAHLSFGIGEILVIRPTAEGHLGAGIGAEASASIEDGTLTLGASAAASLGLGGKLGLEIELDGVAAAKAAHTLADRDQDGSLTLHDGAAGISQSLGASAALTESAIDGFIHVLDADKDGSFSLRDVGQRASTVGQAITDGVKESLHTLPNVARQSTQNVKEVLQKAAALGRGAALDLQDLGAHTRGAVSQLHKKIDHNQDGSLSLRELMMSASQAQEAISENVSQAANAGLETLGHQKDKLQEAVASLRTQTRQALTKGSQSAKEALFSAADRDSDGTLTTRDLHMAARQSGEVLRQGTQRTVQATRLLFQHAQNLAVTTSDQLSRSASTLKSGAASAYKRADAAIDRLVTFFGW